MPPNATARDGDQRRSPSFFGSRATALVPGRIDQLVGLAGFRRRRHRLAYMPFGGGPRICIGQRFAMIEAILILATMAQRFSAELQSDHKVTPFPSITLRPRGGVWLKIKDRHRH